MNEFLEQFSVESRELIAQAGEGLLQLERSPLDTDCLDSVFRAFHTLKGGAGIVEFAAMERAVHAAEDLLSEARAARRVVTPTLVEGCLACLDQLSRWLDTLGASGNLPVDAGVQAEELIAQLAIIGGARSEPSSAANSEQWVESLRSRHSNFSSATTAVRYVPDADCFYQDEDPLVRIAGLPQLLVQELVPRKPWPSLSELDPYTCNLVVLALTQSSVDSVRAHMKGHLGECEIVSLTPAVPSTAGEARFRARARELLQSQVALLMESNPDQLHGRTASAGLVAANALRAVQREQDAESIHRAMQISLSSESTDALRIELERLLAPEVNAVDRSAISQSAHGASRTLRVDAERIDALVRLTAELTTTKNALTHLTARTQREGLGLAAPLTEISANFARLIGDLQQSILALRVLPLRTVLQRFPRLLRDLSSTLGKPVRLEIDGDHIEADKAIVEMLFEPLLHTLRNAVDHGVEQAGVRVERGKPLVATLRIGVTREGDHVTIEVDDDGAGIDVERIRRVALERHVATDEQLSAMDETQILDLIFAPGFSTAASVSEVSGRGVGLDAVRAAVDRVGGHVSVSARPGQGTRVKFAMPFSVMMSQVMTVEAGGQHFGIPLEALVEILKLPAAAVSGVGSARVVVHRERTIPLLDLADELGRTDSPQRQSTTVSVVLATISGEMIALRVDAIGERMEIILKPLEGLLTGMRGISGTTLLGDGRVLLVLDLKELIL